jgi:hypothetical protein
MAVAEVSVEEQLAWEQRARPRAAVIAMAAGLSTIAGLVLAGLASRDQPAALLLDSLQNLEKEGPIGDQPTVHLADFAYTRSHGTGVLLSIVLLAVGLGGIGLTVSFLGRCARARRPQTPRFALPAPVVGGALIGIGVLGVYLAQRVFHADVLDGNRTVDAVRDRPPAEGILLVVELLGLFLFALGSLLVSLNAMRAGLLTRTMGILGMFCGGAIVLFGPTQPLLPLWTAFLAPLFLGRWMGGQPPAWSTGREEPWPTAQEMRNQRLREQGKLTEPDPEPVERAAKPHPSSKKRKRKRRS